MTSSLPVATDSRALGAWLRDATPVDRVGIEERVATLKTRSIKKSSKVWALRLALSMCDITTLEGKDTPGKIRQLATKAMRPLPGDASMPSVAALCCYPDLVGVAKEACGPAHLKVILETGELGTYDDVRRASALAIAAGGDFIKTSTGKVTPAATLPVTLVMLETIREHWNRTGKVVGMKPAGGIRTAKEAIQYLVVVHETLGPDWLTPDRFRFGASSLVNDLLMQLEKEVTGAYADPDDFTLD